MPAEPTPLRVHVRRCAPLDGHQLRLARPQGEPCSYCYNALTLHQTGTVPAGGRGDQRGSTRFRFAYVQDYWAANVASLAQMASTTFANRLINSLSVSNAGTGSGTVSSSPAGISCGSTCSQGYAYGTPVTLTATPATGSTFTGWSGACSGTGTCTVTTNDADSVTATFSLVPETLTVAKSGTGSGTVTSSTAGISCGAVCSHSYPYGTTVTLTAAPATGSTFTSWSGACSGTGTCTVTTQAASSVIAAFGLVPEALTVSKSGTGSGTVTSSTAGISCGSTCSHAYNYGSTVTLTATPATGSTFTGWSGACSGTGTCAVTTNTAISVTANFSLVPKYCVVPKLKSKSLKKGQAGDQGSPLYGREDQARSLAQGEEGPRRLAEALGKRLAQGSKIRLVASKGKH
jgi:Fe-S cluster biogenesis protein NfuA